MKTDPKELPVNPKTGLVPVRMKKPFENFVKDDVAGFPPALAARMIDDDAASMLSPDELAAKGAGKKPAQPK